MPLCTKVDIIFCCFTKARCYLYVSENESESSGLHVGHSFISFISFIYLPATVHIKKELLNNRGNAVRKPKEKPRGL